MKDDKIRLLEEDVERLNEKLRIREARIKELEAKFANELDTLYKTWEDKCNELEKRNVYLEEENKLNKQWQENNILAHREANKIFKEKDDRIKELEASQPKWISVEERLPETRHDFYSKDIFIDGKEYEGKVSEESDVVIVILTNGEICTAKYNHCLPIPFLNEEEWFGWHNDFYGYDLNNYEKVTHWMPLPSAQKSEE